MKLKFNFMPHDDILEAHVEKDGAFVAVYHIMQLEYEGKFLVTVFKTSAEAGPGNQLRMECDDLYAALDAANEHYNSGVV